MKKFPTIPGTVWSFASGWKPWQRVLLCPLLVSPILYFSTLLIACITTNFYWYLFRIDTVFYLQCSFFYIVGVTLVNKYWLPIGLAWVIFFLVLTLAMTSGVDWRGRVITLVQNPVAMLMLMSILGSLHSVKGRIKTPS